MAIQLDLTTTNEVSKTVTIGGKNQRQKLGDISFALPSVELLRDQLNAQGVTRVGEADNGIPNYNNDLCNWLMRTLRSAVGSTVRNKLKPGTMEFKLGHELDTTLEQLTAPPSLGGGEALQQLTALKKAFAEHVAALGKSAGAAALLTSSFNDPKAFMLRNAEAKAKIMPYFESFAETALASGLTPVQEAHISKLLEAESFDAAEALDDL